MSGSGCREWVLQCCSVGELQLRYLSLIPDYKVAGWGGLQTVSTDLHTRHDEGKLLLPPYSASSLLLQIVLSLACLALASAAPQQPYVDPEAGVPKPYSYAYAVADDYSKANFQKTESQDANVRIR